jgi:hypothetical protein
MFDGDLFLLAKLHQRGLRQAATQGRPEREMVRQSDEVKQRRAAAEKKLLQSGTRRG